MLSKQAFNALLKTLEEPPEHVIFIFATTEIRKVPITVLSRCQRFDLRRVDVPTLAGYYKQICDKEGVAADEDALTLIARAADGSVRDGLSLLDQAIALSGEKIELQQINDMLGLADRGLVLDLFESALKADTSKALDIADDLYRKGADPIVLIQDMMEFSHLLTRMRAVPGKDDAYQAVGPDTLKRAQELSAEISMPSLGRAWQILLKGLNEVQNAPTPQSAAEMIVIRLAYASDLPDPRDLLRKIKNDKSDVSKSDASPVVKEKSPAPEHEMAVANNAPAQSAGGAVAQAVEVLPAVDVVSNSEVALSINSLEDIETALKENGDLIIANHLYNYVHLIRLDECLLEFRPAQNAPQSLASDLRTKLNEITSSNWMVTVSSHKEGARTLAQKKASMDQKIIDEAASNPVVKAVIKAFPDATLCVKEKNA